MEGGALVFYTHPVSQPARAVKAVLEIGKVEHSEKVIDILGGESQSEEYKKINKRGLVPAI